MATMNLTNQLIDGDSVFQVPVARLRNLCDPIQVNPWGCQISPREVKKAVETGKFQTTPWKKSPRRLTSKERKYHIERVAYFVVHAWSDPIDLDVGVPSLGCYVRWLIQDGNHRFYAAVIRGDQFILSTLSGDLNHAQEMLGVRAID
jgi:hypothetical protein